jgi:hypothetical protein
MKFSNVKPGDIITFVCGPGESKEIKYASRKGIAYGVEETRWGSRLRVKMEDFTFNYVSSFSTVGIGAYHFPKEI